MRERRETEELSKTMSFGVLAENMVAVTGRLLREEPLTEVDTSVLTDAEALFRGLESVAQPGPQPRNRRLAPEEGHLAISAFRVRERTDVLNTDEERALLEFVHNLLDVLERARVGNLGPDDREGVEVMRSFFDSLGRVTLRRTQDLIWSRRRDPSQWTPLRETLSS